MDETPAAKDSALVAATSDTQLTAAKTASEDSSQEIATTTDDLAAEAIHEDEAAPVVAKHDGDDLQPPLVAGDRATHDEGLYSVIPRKQRIAIIAIAALAGMLSPLTGAIYFPALTTIADDLRVKTSLVNLSITTYQIFQGLAPTFVASLSDNHGRRPAYVLALLIYLVANLALALQNNYAALMVLRCLQSAGSSATIALGNAIVADTVVRAERGRWVGYTGLGISLGPALGPVFGGVLNQYLGWHSIFWFLFIISAVLLIGIVILLPETGRAVVGNGSVPPKWWNLSCVQWLRLKQGKVLNGGPQVDEDRSTISRPKRRPNPISALRILLEPEGCITVGFGSILFAGYFMVMTTLSEQLTKRFGYSSTIVGLCFLPIGVGGLLSRFTAGLLFDWNFRRHARLLGHSIDLARQQQLEMFPIERIRLEICIPMVYVSCGTLLAYAWTLESQASLAGILVSLFFMGLFFSGVQQGFNTLIVDTHADMPATATAANNLFRCLMSAGATAVAPFLIEKIGVGYMGVFISGVWFLLTPLLWLVLFRGKKWRDNERKRQEEKATKEQAEKGPGV
ncbi:quinidine resistance protein 2 [Coleophoma cylindrospora]|uniref:Quinidine resistance protein 2 n=1 Tax=Coleophoma cylindrospora TaxID=1849047 RepID=A0A3D8Q6N8_9HELO|nr:quinidine resistance protein 2 [Coleophoma cylindrospora]